MAYSDINVYKEAQKKREDWKKGKDLSIKSIQKLVLRNFGKDALEKTLNSIKSFFILKTKNNYHTNLDSYISHSLRVTKSLINYETSFIPNQIPLAIYHNLFEVFDVSTKDSKSLLIKDDYVSTVKLLYIDREKEFDESYLELFYNKILQDDLACVIRTHDKIDNMLTCSVIKDDVYRNEYIRLSEKYVSELAKKCDKKVENLFHKSCNYAKKKGHDIVFFNSLKKLDLL